MFVRLTPHKGQQQKAVAVSKIVTVEPCPDPKKGCVISAGSTFTVKETYDEVMEMLGNPVVHDVDHPPLESLWA